MEFVVTKLNYTAYELDRLYNINSGGCCYLAYKIAYWLEKYGIEYYFVIQNDNPIINDIGKHYCLQVLPSKLYLNKSPLYTHIKSIKRTSSQILDYYKKSSWSEKYDALNNSVQENIKGIRVVKSYVREDHEIEKFEKISTSIYNDFTFAEKLIAFNMPLMQFCMYACMILISWFGAKLIVTTGNDPVNGMSTGQLMSLVAYAMQILMSLMMLSMVFVMIIISRASAERIVEILDEKSDLTNGESPVTEVKDGSIVFDHVSFSYTGKKDKICLSDINLNIRSGETVGIIGGTGSAKTTLVQLIPRLYDVTEGSLKVGGLDTRKYDLEALRDQVAMVLQKNVLFSVIKDTRSTSGIVDLVTNVDYVPLVNHYLEQRSYPAPAQEQEEEAPKKAAPRVRPEHSSPQRGSGSTARQTRSTDMRTTETTEKPSVKSRLEALRAASEGMREPGRAPQAKGKTIPKSR